MEIITTYDDAVEYMKKSDSVHDWNERRKALIKQLGSYHHYIGKIDSSRLIVKVLGMDSPGMPTIGTL